MLREIISITGRPGLFKMLGHGNRRIIVEDITSGKRFPALERDNIISLGDIAMYTSGEDKPLGEILDLTFEKQGGKTIDIKGLGDAKNLRSLFKEILPDFDEDRVHDSDIKKLFTWYNILVQSGMNKFTEDKDEEKEGEKKEEEGKKEERKKDEGKKKEVKKKETKKEE